MGKTNIVVRLLFIIFNVLFAIVGCVLLGLMVTVIVDLYRKTPAHAGFLPLALPLLASFAVIGVSVLGVYGASKEKRIPLIIFAVFMGIAAVTMAALGFEGVALIHQWKSLTRPKPLMPETFIRPETLATVEYVQSIALGFYFGTAAVALLGMLMSIFMVRQIKRKERSAEGFVSMRTTSGDTHLVDANY